MVDILDTPLGSDFVHYLSNRHTRKAPSCLNGEKLKPPKLIKEHISNHQSDTILQKFLQVGPVEAHVATTGFHPSYMLQ